MKIKSTASIFWYDSAYWTSATEYNWTDLSFATDLDSKYKPYYNLAWTTIRLCMDAACIDKANTWKVSDYVLLSNSTQIWYTNWATTAQTNANTFLATTLILLCMTNILWFIMICIYKNMSNN